MYTQVRFFSSRSEICFDPGVQQAAPWAGHGYASPVLQLSQLLQVCESPVRAQVLSCAEKDTGILLPAVRSPQEEVLREVRPMLGDGQTGGRTADIAPRLSPPRVVLPWVTARSISWGPSFRADVLTE